MADGSGVDLARSIVGMAFGAGLMLNALLFVPQIRTILKTKSAKGVSLLSFTGFTVMQAIGVLHGALQGDMSLALGMGASFLTCGSVTLLAFLYRNR